MKIGSKLRKLDNLLSNIDNRSYSQKTAFSNTMWEVDNKIVNWMGERPMFVYLIALIFWTGFFIILLLLL